MREVREDGVLTMVIAGSGGMIVGKQNGNKLLRPRVFTVFDEKEYNPKTGKEEKVMKMHLSPLPGTPPYVFLGNEMKYPIPINELNKTLIDLYERVTSPQVDPN